MRAPFVYVAIGLPERLARLRSRRCERLYAKALARASSVVAYSEHEAEVLTALAPRPGGGRAGRVRPVRRRRRRVPPGDVGARSRRRLRRGRPAPGLRAPARRRPLAAGGALPRRDEREHARSLGERPPNVSVETDLPFDEMRDRLERARVVALPVRDNSYSGATTVLLQAMALAKPVVVTRTAAIATGYGLVDGENVRLAAPGDAARSRGGRGPPRRTSRAQSARRARARDGRVQPRLGPLRRDARRPAALRRRASAQAGRRSGRAPPTGPMPVRVCEEYPGAVSVRASGCAAQTSSGDATAGSDDRVGRPRSRVVDVAAPAVVSPSAVRVSTGSRSQSPRHSQSARSCSPRFGSRRRSGATPVSGSASRRGYWMAIGSTRTSSTTRIPLFFYSYAATLRIAGVRGPFALEVVWLAMGTVGLAMTLRALRVGTLAIAHRRGRISARADGVVVRAGCDDGARARHRPRSRFGCGLAAPPFRRGVLVVVSMLFKFNLGLVVAAPLDRPSRSSARPVPAADAAPSR